jgi:hypothetical protein
LPLLHQITTRIIWADWLALELQQLQTLMERQRLVNNLLLA